MLRILGSLTNQSFIFPESLSNYRCVLSNQCFIFFPPGSPDLVFSMFWIFCHCRSSSAFSSFGPARRVLRPSAILTPYWKAALKHRINILTWIHRFIVAFVMFFPSTIQHILEMTWNMITLILCKFDIRLSGDIDTCTIYHGFIHIMFFFFFVNFSLNLCVKFHEWKCKPQPGENWNTLNVSNLLHCIFNNFCTLKILFEHENLWRKRLSGVVL